MTQMKSEEHVKVKTQATSATINFVRDLIVIDENNIEDVKKESQVIEEYTEPLLKICAEIIEESLSSSYTPLQEEILALVSCVA